jgi:hypothetical protein
MLHWSISHSSLEASMIRTNLAAAKERQFRAWNFPANISGPEEMEAWWNALDFGGRKSVALPLTASDAVTVGEINDAMAGDGSHATADREEGLIEEEGSEVVEGRGTQPLFNPRLFRQPSINIELLRRLSREGREETLRAEAEEEAMGKEKMVWGTAENNGHSNTTPSSDSGKQLAEDSSSSAFAQASGTGTADAVKSNSEMKDKE